MQSAVQTLDSLHPPLFSDAWLENYQKSWSTRPRRSDTHAMTEINGVIAIGFDDQEQPACMLSLEGDVLTCAAQYDGRPLQIDIRACDGYWQAWCQRRLDAQVDSLVNCLTVGVAFAARNLQLRRGDYLRLISDESSRRLLLRILTHMAHSRS